VCATQAFGALRDSLAFIGCKALHEIVDLDGISLQGRRAEAGRCEGGIADKLERLRRFEMLRDSETPEDAAEEASASEVGLSISRMIGPDFRRFAAEWIELPVRDWCVELFRRAEKHVFKSIDDVVATPIGVKVSLRVADGQAMAGARKKGTGTRPARHFPGSED
jgi:hypothetical protein